jgi:Protein of unknown function (DUF1566)
MYRYCLLVATLAVAGSFGSALAADTPPAGQGNIKMAAGERITDGTIYAGISPETDQPLYTTTEAVHHHYNWHEAAEYCAAMKTQAQPDWRVPTKDELKVLYKNYDAIGGFDTSGLEGFGWYWSSSSEDDQNAWAQRFSDGLQYQYLKNHGASVRCVR